jgi:hypothetical protein
METTVNDTKINGTDRSTVRVVDLTTESSQSLTSQETTAAGTTTSVTSVDDVTTIGGYSEVNHAKTPFSPKLDGDGSNGTTESITEEPSVIDPQTTTAVTYYSQSNVKNR